MFSWVLKLSMKKVQNNSRNDYVDNFEPASAFNFAKSNTFPWVIFKLFKLHRWYQIAQTIIYNFKIQGDFEN